MNFYCQAGAGHAYWIVDSSLIIDDKFLGQAIDNLRRPAVESHANRLRDVRRRLFLDPGGHRHNR
jgi:hypothetical protein